MKYFSVLILASWVLFSLFYSQTSHAVSENIAIMQLQTAGSVSGTSTEEYVLLKNISDVDVNVTNWCIEYTSSNDNFGFSACIEPNSDDVELWLEAGGLVSFSTTSFDDSNAGFVSDFQLSGGMNSNEGHLYLYDAQENEIDRVGWGGAVNPEDSVAQKHATGEVLSRDFGVLTPDTDNNQTDFSSTPILNVIESGLYEVEVVIDLCANIDGVQATYPAGYLADENGDCFEDFCPDIDGLQLVAPEGYEKKLGSQTCTLIPLEDAILLITELLPNPPSYDSGQEFIEIYNPNNRQVNLNGYSLQIGPSFKKEFVFSEGLIKSGHYQTFSDDLTGITLPNSAGQKIRMIAPAGNTVSESAIYSNADDDVSWALVEDLWIFTNQITPASANLPYLEPAVEEVAGVTSVLAPCPPGKFRNPETNRCKNIESTTSQLKPCGPGEFRNPETNRCKKIASTSSSLGPCPEGQERNPETNRCRKVATLASADVSGVAQVTDVTPENTEGQINWLVIFVAVLGTIGYMAYEWRVELSRIIARYKR